MRPTENVRLRGHERPKLDNASLVPGPPSHDDIARRAYELFVARGGEPGHDLEDWLAAERELVESPATPV